MVTSRILREKSLPLRLNPFSLSDPQPVPLRETAIFRPAVGDHTGRHSAYGGFRSREPHLVNGPAELNFSRAVITAKCC